MKPEPTCGICNARECAFGSVHGLVFEGQLKVACCAGGLGPTGKVTFCIAGGGRKSAVTAIAALTVTVQVAAVPELAHAPPHPANVEGAVGAAVRVTMVPGAYVGEQVPVTTPFASAQLVSARLSVTRPLPVPRSLTVRAGLPPPRKGGAMPPQPSRIMAHTKANTENREIPSFMVPLLRERERRLRSKSQSENCGRSLSLPGILLGIVDSGAKPTLTDIPPGKTNSSPE